MSPAAMLLALFAVQIDRQTVTYSGLPLHGTVHNKTLYGFFGEKQGDFVLDAVPIKSPPKIRGDAMFPHPLRKPNPADAPPRPGWKAYWLCWGQPPQGYLCRHQIKFDSIWIATGPVAVSRLKFSELNLFDISNKDLLIQYSQQYPVLKAPTGEFLQKGEFHQVSLRTMDKKYQKSFIETEGAGGDGKIARSVLSLGGVATSEKCCKCYMLLKPNESVEIWDTEFRWDRQIQRWETIADAKNLESIRAPFAEDFFFFIRRTDYYFVTESGKLYIAPAPKPSEKSRTMKALWDDAKKPIVAVIEDADNDKVWLFAKDKNAGAKLDLYFEMKDTIRPESFDPAKLRPVNVEGRAKMLLGYLPLISKNEKPR